MSKVTVNVWANWVIVYNKIVYMTHEMFICTARTENTVTFELLHISLSFYFLLEHCFSVTLTGSDLLLPRLFLTLTDNLPHSYQNYHQDYFDRVTGKVLRESSDNLQLGIAINNINPNAYRREISKHTIVSI